MDSNPTWLQRIETLTGKTILRTQSIQRGYTPAARLLISFFDGSSAFAKIGTTPLTSGWLRREKQIYETLHAPFMPEFLGWEDDPEHPILLLEDLRHAHWPPPWSAKQIDQVLETLQQIWNSPPPDWTRPAHFLNIEAGWFQVAENPEPFLSLNLTSETWLEAALPTLLNIDGEELLKGDAFLHLDVRSDNICFDGDRVVLVDWNLTALGNPKIDVGFWLPSLEAEGGPRPEVLLPDAGDIAGIVSGFYASRAGLPNIPDAPFVRHIQQVQLKTALPWAVRALDLPPLDL